MEKALVAAKKNDGTRETALQVTITQALGAIGEGRTLLQPGSRVTPCRTLSLGNGLNKKAIKR